jgi:hypothetical protein
MSCLKEVLIHRFGSMEQNAIDEAFGIGEDAKMADLKNWASIILLWVGIILCGFSGWFYMPKVIIAIPLLVIATVSTYYKYKWGVKITVGLITIGTAKLIFFFPLNVSIGTSLNSISIAVDPILLGIGIVHYFTNRAHLSIFFKEVFSNEQTKEEIKSSERNKINGFKKRFENKSQQELMQVIDNEKLVSTAKAAAVELLEEYRIRESL